MYGLLLELLGKGLNLKPKQLTASLGDCHLYNNHIEQAKKQLSRDMLNLPKVEIAYGLHIDNYGDIYIPGKKDIKIINYNHHEPIKAKLSVGK
jgi:thymidylate synthase